MPRTKKYTVSFYSGYVVDGTDTPPSLSSLLQDASLRDLPLEQRVRGQVLQLRELEVMPGGRMKGVMAKFRDNDLPNIGNRSSTDERPIDMEDLEGLIEKNYFLYDPGLEVLTFQINGAGMNINQAASLLSEVLGQNSALAISLSPVLRSGAIERILQGQVSPRKFELSFSRPTSPSVFNGNDFSGPLMALLNSTDGVSCSVTVSANPPGRSAVRNFLNDTVASGMTNFLDSTTPVNMSKIWFGDDKDPIDLIEDRIKGYTDSVPLDGRYPIPESIYAALDRVRENYIDDIRSVLTEHGL